MICTILTSTHSHLQSFCLSFRLFVCLFVWIHDLQATHFQSIGGVRERGVVDSLSNGERERERERAPDMIILSPLLLLLSYQML